MAFKKISDTLHRTATAARLAQSARSVRRAPDAEQREKAQRALAALMADARGVPLKVGQILGTLGQGDDFADLARGVTPQPMSIIGPAVDAALGQPRENVFSEFDDHGIAASLGQVHRARLHTGEGVAVKVQYPDIASAIDAEMRLARLVPGLGPVRRWGFDLDGYKQVLYDDMRAELDYRGELARQAAFRQGVQFSGLVVPQVYPEWSSETLLVQAWEDGQSLDEISNWPEADRRHVAVVLMCTLFQSLFVYGAVHGDPHMGNYRFRRSSGGRPEVVLLDFGCIVDIPRPARLALLRLILGALDDDGTDPFACFQAMGFDPEKLQPIQSVLPALTKVLVEPFTVSYAFPVDQWQIGARVDTLLGELKWWFRAAGPPELLLLLRAFHGLRAQLNALRVNVPWQSILFRIVGRDLREAAQAMDLPARPPGLSGSSLCFDQMARYLKVSVTDHGRQVASVTLPSSQVTVLEELVPEDVLAKLERSAVNLDGIKAKACTSGMVPQPLFEHRDGDKHYRVWLE